MYNHCTILRMSPSVGENSPTQTNMKKWQGVKELIGNYNGNDYNHNFDRWEKRMRKLLSSYYLDEQSAKTLVCSRLSGNTLQWSQIPFESRLSRVKSQRSFTWIKENVQQLKQLTLRYEHEARKWNVILCWLYTLFE